MTWEELIGADRTVLEELMRTGATPDPNLLMGHTYNGLNIGWVTQITGRRFKKVFHEEDDGRSVTTSSSGVASRWSSAGSASAPRVTLCASITT